MPPHKFRCGVCTFAHPLSLARALPKCGHTFCAECTPRLARCPLCRVPVRPADAVRVHIDIVGEDDYDDDFVEEDGDGDGDGDGEKGERAGEGALAKHARYVRKGLAKMGADTPVRSVRKAQEELAKIADAEPVPLLLQALTDFKERIIPLFELADTLKRCKTDLAACHSRVSTLESRISALEADRSRASTDRSRASQLRNEADERRREATELRQQTAALRHEAVELRAKADELRANVHRQTRLAESAVDTAARAGAEVVELRRANRSLLQEVARAQEEVTRAQEAEKAAVGEREAAVAEGARDRAEVVRFQGIVQGHQMKAEAGKRKRKGLVEEVRRLERENKRLQEVLGQKEMEMDDSLRVISESQEQSQELALEREQELALHTSDFATSPPRPAPSSSSLTRTHTILRSSPPPSCNDPEPDWTPGATFGTDWNLPPRVGVDKNNNNSKKRKLEISARPKLDLRAGPKPKLDIRAGPKPKLDLRAGPENNLYKARGFPIRLDARGRERGVVQLGPGGRRGLGRGG